MEEIIRKIKVELSSLEVALAANDRQTFWLCLERLEGVVDKALAEIEEEFP